MTMRRLAVALVLAGILAGCLGGRDGGDGTPGPTSTATGTGSSTTTSTGPPALLQVLDLLLAFDFVGCSGLSVQQARPLEDVQALLPPGFTAVASPDSAVPTSGVLAVDLFQCGNLTTSAVAVPDVYLGLVYTYVARPLERVPGAPDRAVQEYVFRLLSGERVLAALWPAAGYDTYNGTANVTVGPIADGPDPFVRFGQGSVGDYFLAGTGANLAPLPATRTQGFARYTVLAGDDSVLLWTGTYDFPASATGPGVMQVAASDPFAQYATPREPTLAGMARQYDAGAVRAQDLRRIFT